jgi:hypothetical protein
MFAMENGKGEDDLKHMPSMQGHLLDITTCLLKLHVRLAQIQNVYTFFIMICTTFRAV